MADQKQIVTAVAHPQGAPQTRNGIALAKQRKPLEPDGKSKDNEDIMSEDTSFDDGEGDAEVLGEVDEDGQKIIVPSIMVCPPAMATFSSNISGKQKLLANATESERVARAVASADSKIAIDEAKAKSIEDEKRRQAEEKSVVTAAKLLAQLGAVTTPGVVIIPGAKYEQKQEGDIMGSDDFGSVRNARYKIVFIGDTTVGKTSLIEEFMFGHGGRGNNRYYQPTRAVDTITRMTTLEDGRTVYLNMWDVPGSEEFRARNYVTKYIEKCCIVVMVYDITKRFTFLNIDTWLQDAQKINKDIILVLIGNKTDLSYKREVPYNDGVEKAKQLGSTIFYETSAETGENVKTLFRAIALSLPPVFGPKTLMNEEYVDIHLTGLTASAAKNAAVAFGNVATLEKRPATVEMQTFTCPEDPEEDKKMLLEEESATSSTSCIDDTESSHQRPLFFCNDFYECCWCCCCCRSKNKLNKAKKKNKKTTTKCCK